jgi:hypothetical protein
MSSTTAAVPSRCGNDGCGEVGKMKCTACQSINYCSVECQKVHWTLHKPACKLAKEKNGKRIAGYFYFYYPIKNLHYMSSWNDQ